MKKYFLLYQFVIYLISFFLELYSFFVSSEFGKSSLAFLFSLIGLMITYNLLITLDSWKKNSIRGFIVLIGLQTFFWGVNGIGFKIIFGIDIYFGFKKVGADGDLFFTSMAKFFSNLFYISTKATADFIIFGINIIPLIIFIYFLKFWKQNNKEVGLKT